MAFAYMNIKAVIMLTNNCQKAKS